MSIEVVNIAGPQFVARCDGDRNPNQLEIFIGEVVNCRISFDSPIRNLDWNHDPPLSGHELFIRFEGMEEGMVIGRHNYHQNEWAFSYKPNPFPETPQYIM